MNIKVKSIVVLLLSVILVGCSASNSKLPKVRGEINYTSVKNVVGTEASESDNSYIYNSLDDLITKSQEIIEGTVQDISYFDKGIITYSKILMKVNEAYYGSLKKGDTVTVIEPGGYTTLANYIKQVGKDRFPNVSDKDALSQYVKRPWDGTNITEVEENLLIFGAFDKSGITEFSSDYLQVLGYTEGQFNIDNSSVKRKNSDASIKPLEMTKDDYKNIIKEHLKAIKK